MLALFKTDLNITLIVSYLSVVFMVKLWFSHLPYSSLLQLWFTSTVFLGI